jgi:hypothetical protein
LKERSGLKKYIWVIALLIFLSAVATSLLFITNEVGATSGTVRLFVDGEEMEIDGVVVEFSFTRAGVHEFSEIRQLENARFHFNIGAYGFYYINFSLDPNIWEELGELVHFEIQYFNTSPRAHTDFDIRIELVSEVDHKIEVAANVGRAGVSSGKVLIEPSGMTIVVRIPSP